MEWNYLYIPKLQRLHRWILGMDKQFHPTHYRTCDYLSMLGLKLNHVSKRGLWCVSLFMYSDLLKLKVIAPWGLGTLGLIWWTNWAACRGHNFILVFKYSLYNLLFPYASYHLQCRCVDKFYDCCAGDFSSSVNWTHRMKKLPGMRIRRFWMQV